MNLHNILLLGNDMIIPRDPMDWGNPWNNEPPQVNSGGSGQQPFSSGDEEDSLLSGQEEPSFRPGRRQGGAKQFVSETEDLKRESK